MLVFLVPPHDVQIHQTGYNLQLFVKFFHDVVILSAHPAITFQQIYRMLHLDALAADQFVIPRLILGKTLPETSLQKAIKIINDK